MLYMLVNGQLWPCPTEFNGAGNLRDEYWAQHGGKPLRHVSRPQGQYTLTYRDAGDALEEVWTPRVPAPTSPRVLALREAYKQASRTLCQLGGVQVKDKLEDEEYTQVATAAYATDAVAAAITTDTMLYTLSTLRLDDGRDAWDRI